MRKLALVAPLFSEAASATPDPSTTQTAVIYTTRKFIAVDPIGFIVAVVQALPLEREMRSRWVSGRFCVLQVEDVCVTGWERK